MTLPEYLYRMKAHSLSRVDVEYDMHLSAWLNQQVGAIKDQGKKQVPVHKRFTEFFDYEERVKSVLGEKPNRMNPQHRRMARIASELNKNT